MNFVKQFVAFGTISAETLPKIARLLYITLFLRNNQEDWVEWFSARNRSLAAETDIDERTLINNRNILKQKGFIDFIPGKTRKDPVKYKLIKLYVEDENTGEIPQENVEVLQEKCSENVEVLQEKCSENAKPTIIYKNINLNKTKTSSARAREEEPPPKKPAFVPPTLEEVKAYCQEKGLTVDPQQFFDYFTAGDWHDSENKPVKRWKQKILTWQKFQNEKGLQPHNQATADDEPLAFASLRAVLERDDE